MHKPLEGIKVVELGTHVAVPKLSRFMADWGAEVIKVEPPKGEPLRTVGPAYEMPCSPENNPIFQVENLNKRSIFLDLKSDEGRAIMYRLLENADVFCTNTRLKALNKLGLDYETVLKDKFPGLIVAHFGGAGEKGPEKDVPGFDKATFWAKSGIPVEWTWGEDNPPFVATPGVGDSTSGAILLSGVLAALYAREKTGRGDFVSGCLYSSALWVNSIGILEGQPRYGIDCPKKIPVDPLCPPYKSKDGDWIMVGSPLWEPFYPKIFRLIGLESYIGDPRLDSREAARENNNWVCGLIRDAYLNYSTEELLRLFAEHDVVHSKFANPKDIWKDEQAWANDFLGTITLENGDDVVVPRVPVTFRSVDELPPMKLAPQMGEHTAEILQEMGYTQEEIGAFAAEGIVTVQ